MESLICHSAHHSMEIRYYLLFIAAALPKTFSSIGGKMFRSSIIGDEINPFVSKFPKLQSCSCDTYVGICDTICSCDSDCSNFTIARTKFRLKDALDRQFSVESLLEILLSFFDGILGIFLETNPYLDTVYIDSKLATSNSEYTALLNNATSQNANFESYTKSSMPDDPSSNYYIGRPVQNDPSSSYPYFYINSNFGFGSDCDFPQVVKFARNFETRCIVPLSIEKCAENTNLGAKFFAETQIPRILSSPNSNYSSVVTVNVEYCENSSSAVEDASTLEYSNQILDILQNFSKVDREEKCSSIADSPILTENATICEKVLSEISHTFYWKDGSIENLRIKLKTRNIQISGSSFVQEKKVEWKHVSERSVVSSKYNFPGDGFYRTGMNVYGVRGQFSSDIRAISVNDFEPLSLISPTGDGRCSQVARWGPYLKMNENVDSFCNMKVRQTEFFDCRRLRIKVRSVWDPFEQFSFVVGDLRTNVVMNQLLKIIQLSNGSFYDDEQHLNRNSFSASCPEIPNQISLIVYHRKIEAIYGPVFQILGAVKRFDNSTWTFRGRSVDSDFPLSFRVRFLEVPSDIFSVPKFYINFKSLWCLNSPSDSVCWNELFYIFDLRQFSDFDMQFVFFVLSTIILTVFVYMIVNLCPM